MKIIDIKSYPIEVTLDRPFANSSERHRKRSSTLVKITSDDGLTGWGEAYGPPVGTAAVIDTYLAPRLMGKDPFPIEFFWYQIQTHKGIPRGAVAGVDMALWDLKARALNVPVYELLGGKCTGVITPYATGFFFSEDDPDSTDFLEKETNAILEKGFKALKMKIGFGKDRDIRRIRTVRRIIGDRIDLMVDANQAYDLMTCLELAPHLTELKVRWLEEPMPWANFAGYRELKTRVSFAIAGGEAEYSCQGFNEAISQRVVDVIQPDTAAAGGLTSLRRIAVLAHAFQIDFQPHVFGTLVSLPAAIQLLASLPNNQSWCLFPRQVFLEWDTTPNPMAEEIVATSFPIENGRYTVPATPGLGIEIDEKAIEHYRIR